MEDQPAELDFSPTLVALEGAQGFDGTEWFGFVRQLHQVLADPTGGHRFLGPRAAFAGDGHDNDEHWRHVASWTTLWYMLTVSLGWENPGAGLVTWFELGRPEAGDVRLALLRRCWGAAPAHLVAFTDHIVRRGFRRSTAWPGSPSPDPRTTERWTVVKRGLKLSGLFGSNGDPLHLVTHTPRPFTPEGEPINVELFEDAARRRAVVTLDRLEGWMGAFEQAVAHLADGGSPSWRVQAVCPSVGWLGEYRWSRETGIWFSGRHRFHMWGAG